MATQTSRRISGKSMGVAVVIAAVLGVGIPYVWSSVMPEAAKVAAKTPAPTPPPAAPPPKIDYLGAGTLVGSEAMLDQGGAKSTTTLGPDDAMVVWLKMDLPARGGRGGGAGGSGPPAAAPRGAQPPSGPAPAGGAPGASGTRAGAGGAGGTGAGGRRPVQAPLTVKDSKGQEYAYSIERKEAGIFAMHLKKGYSEKPDSLQIEEVSAGKTVASWKIDNVPAPTQVVSDNELKGTPLGEIQLRPGRRGRIGASVHFSGSLQPDTGAILTPVAASFVSLSGPQANPLIIKPGQSPFDAPLIVPNAQMAKLVAFDMLSYQAVDATEDVTFHTARIESHFGQPVLVVDKPEVVTTPSGLKLTLIAQDSGPKKTPKNVHNDIDVQMVCDPANLKVESVGGIAPAIGAELVAPKPESLGLERVTLTFLMNSQPAGEQIFQREILQLKPAAGGALKPGPQPITVRVTLTRAKGLGTHRVVIPVNPKIMPSQSGAAPGGLLSAR